MLSSQRKVWASLSSQPCKNTHFLSLKTCTHSSCRNRRRGFLNDFKKKRVRMINNRLRRNESKTRDGSLSYSTLLMEFGVGGVSSFSADGLFPSTSFPATNKCDSETEKSCAKLWLLMALEGLLQTASKRSCHEQEQAHQDHREGSCRA